MFYISTEFVDNLQCATERCLSHTLGTLSKNTHRSMAKQTNAHTKSDVFIYSNRKAKHPETLLCTNSFPESFSFHISSIRLQDSESL